MEDDHCVIPNVAVLSNNKADQVRVTATSIREPESNRGAPCNQFCAQNGVLRTPGSSMEPKGAEPIHSPRRTTQGKTMLGLVNGRLCKVKGSSVVEKLQRTNLTAKGGSKGQGDQVLEETEVTREDESGAKDSSGKRQTREVSTDLSTEEDSYRTG